MDFGHREQRAPTAGNAANDAMVPGKRTLTESVDVQRRELDAQLSESTPAASALFAELARCLESPRPLPNGISGMLHGRAVQAERIPGAIVDWVVLRATVCAAAEMDPHLVLERNARLAFGALALAGGEYWLRIALPADTAELADPAHVIDLLVAAADSLVPHHTPSSDSASFAHWTA